MSRETSECSAQAPAAMQETTEQPTTVSEVPDGLKAAALRAEAWAGEPFLHDERGPRRGARAGHRRAPRARRGAAEIEAGRKQPSAQWKVRFGLMLGLERVLSEKPPQPRVRHRAPAPPGRRARRDADRADRGQPADERGRRTGTAPALDGRGARGRGGARGNGARAARRRATTSCRAARPGQDPGRRRRYRFRHPTASGKTIAAAGFVEAARTLGVLILTHRRLLVSQFTRELTDHGYGDRLTERSSRAARRRATTRSRSRPTPGSRATWASSTARPTTS